MIMIMDNFDFNDMGDMDVPDSFDYDTNIEGASQLEFDADNISGPDDYFDVDNNKHLWRNDRLRESLVREKYLRYEILRR